MQTATLGKNITSLGEYAFSGCSSLDNFAFGSAVETIAQEAFSDCVNVTKIICRAATPPACGTQALGSVLGKSIIAINYS